MQAWVVTPRALVTEASIAAWGTLASVGFGASGTRVTPFFGVSVPGTPGSMHILLCYRRDLIDHSGSSQDIEPVPKLFK